MTRTGNARIGQIRYVEHVHEQITFPGAHGHPLSARVEVPDEPARGQSPTARPYALFAHCFTCSKDIAAASRIARALRAEGVGVVRFDFTGLGNSEGDFANTTFSSNVQDLVAAAGYMRANLGAPALLVGHSLGGAAVLAAAHAIPECKAVVTIGAPADPAHVEHLLSCSIEAIERDGHAEVALGGRTFTIKKQFLDDLRAQQHEKRIARLNRALLIMHAPQDEVVSIDQARLIYDAAKHPKSFVSMDGADHLLTDKRDSVYVARTIAAWAQRYVPAIDTPAPAPGDLPEGEVLVETKEGKFAQWVSAGPHHWVADEPKHVGGSDSGPSPYDMLLGALGACTTMTLQMYARRKQWPLERVKVHLTHERLYAQDCAECEQSEGKVERITRTLTLEGPLDEAQKARLLEIADRCPVHRTLEGKPTIVTKRA